MFLCVGTQRFLPHSARRLEALGLRCWVPRKLSLCADSSALARAEPRKLCADSRAKHRSRMGCKQGFTNRFLGARCIDEIGKLFSSFGKLWAKSATKMEGSFSALSNSILASCLFAGLRKLYTIFVFLYHIVLHEALTAAQERSSTRWSSRLGTSLRRLDSQRGCGAQVQPLSGLLMS